MHPDAYEKLRSIEREAFKLTGGPANGGLTIRDYFAAKAMQGFIAGSAYNHESFLYREVSAASYEMADAMLNERNK